MPLPSFNDGLRVEYINLFNTCAIDTNKIPFVEKILTKIISNKSRYEKVGKKLNIPWYFIAAIHQMEASMNFRCHLHNGDPLTAKTKHVPAGRPLSGSPPYNWEDSAADALTMMKLDQWDDWSVAGLLYKTESYNGWGYRMKHPHVYSPYLWSFSNHYQKGKYIADGTWSDSAVSQQCGAAVLLRRLAEKNEITFSGEPKIIHQAEIGKPVVRFSNTKIPYAENLQNFLNTIPGIYVKPDGCPGEKTSEAFKKVTGYYLMGDERNG